MAPIALPVSGITRHTKKLRWSLRRRLSPTRPMILPFDDGLKIAVRPVDRLGRRIWLDGYSEPEFAGLLDAYLRPGMTYFDVGAHFGQYVLVAAEILENHVALCGNVYSPYEGRGSKFPIPSFTCASTRADLTV